MSQNSLWKMIPEKSREDVAYLRDIPVRDRTGFRQRGQSRCRILSFRQGTGAVIHFNRGSHVHQLVTILSFTGEYPSHSLFLLGNRQVMRRLVRRLISPQTFRNDATGEEHTCRLLTVTGKGHDKTIRLYKGALGLLEWLHPSAYKYYMGSFWQHKFPGDSAHRERHHRVAEAAAVCMNSGLEARPFYLPELQNRRIAVAVPEKPVFYLAKDIKRVGGNEMNKTMFTRMAGAVFSPGGCYAVYNTRNRVMKWNGMGEFKALHSLIEIGRMNAGVPRVDSAILIGQSYEVALRTLLETEKNPRLEFRFDRIYHHIHFVSMDAEGFWHLRLLTLSDWKQDILDLLFEKTELALNQGFFEYDAYIDGCYVFSFLDGDLARLIRFREALAGGTERCEVLCFPHQLRLLKEYLGDGVSFKTIQMKDLLDGLGIRKEDGEKSR